MYYFQDVEYFFPSPPFHSSRLRLTATLSNCTLCIVKPHAIREGKLGAALEAIDEGGFDITALSMFIVENINAAEFFEVYKGIVQEYKVNNHGLSFALNLKIKPKLCYYLLVFVM